MDAQVIGTLQEGKWISICAGLGFYLPESLYAAAKACAVGTGRIQFATVLEDGTPFWGTREDCLKVSNMVAWITPRKEGCDA